MTATMTTSRVLSALTKSAETWNGALSYSTTGTDKLGTCLDYWTKAGTYTKRDQAVVDTDMGRIFSDDPQVALRILFGLRLITRKPNVNGFEEVQTGYGRKDEFYKGIVWLHHNHPDVLYRNLHLIPVFGCWKDLMQEPLVDVLDRQKVYELIKANLDDQLLRKYLPTLRSKKNVRTERDGKRVRWAKGLIAFLGVDDRAYRKLKSEGAAHIWQKQMQRNQWDQINFNGIPGRAMTRHTSQKGKKDKLSVFERHGQVERLKDWVLSQKSIKFTGYPYDLTRAATSSKNPSMIQRFIYDKQFETLIEPMRNHSLGNVLACLDTSGSMSMEVVPGGVRAIDICISMGVVFSALNVGYFKDAVCAFDNNSTLHKMAGGFCDRLHYIERMATAWGSTNFQSVIDLLVRVRKENPEIPVSEYPETLLVISDMQFNPVGHGPRGVSLAQQTETNYEAAKRKLNEAGLGDVRIIWWWVNGAGTDFPSKMDDKGVYMIGGFDPVNIKALMGLSADPAKKDKKDFKAEEKKEETPLDGMMNFLSQPIFALVE